MFLLRRNARSYGKRKKREDQAAAIIMDLYIEYNRLHDKMSEIEEELKEIRMERKTLQHWLRGYCDCE